MALTLAVWAYLVSLQSRHDLILLQPLFPLLFLLLLLCLLRSRRMQFVRLQKVETRSGGSDTLGPARGLNHLGWLFDVMRSAMFGCGRSGDLFLLRSIAVGYAGGIAGWGVGAGSGDGAFLCG